MFSLKKDKTGFFSALSLIIVASTTLITTSILLAKGIYEGDWDHYTLLIKIVLGVSWVACIGIVLLRIGVFAVQRDLKKVTEYHLEQQQKEQQDPQIPPE